MIDKRDTPVLGSPNPFKLAVFSHNMAGGANLTKAPGTPRVTWDESVRIARAAERAGIEAVIPVARWKGMHPAGDGAPPEVHRAFETFTWAAGLAALTERIQVFATFHVPTVHPVRAAKEIATVDHISGGRFALNVVAGWNQDEFQMFDLTLSEHDDRYAVADEWMGFLTRIWAEEEPFDVDGEHFRARHVISEPKPLQRPGPVIMNAGFSPAGRAFAARHADISFVILPDLATAADQVAALKAAARERHGRELLVFGAGHILCRDSEAAARREHRRVVHELGDWEAAAFAIDQLIPGSRSADWTHTMGPAAIFGFFATPLVGTPEQVVQGVADMAATGLDGMAVSWVDYEEGIAQYDEVLRPLMVQAGLRAGAPALEGVR